MAPFKFGKKQKNRKDLLASSSNTTPNSNNSGASSSFQQEMWSPGSNQTPTKQNYPKPAANSGVLAAQQQRVMVNPVEQRSTSTQSNLQQQVFTPWNRIRLKQSPFPRYRHVASAYATEQGELFVIGGLHDQSVYGDTWIIKSLENATSFDSFTVPIADATPPPRVGHASTLCGNAFVIFGGDTHKVNEAGLMDDDIYLFNINSHKWTIPSPQGPRPLGRYGHKISIVAANQMKTKLYVFGGQFDDTYFNDLAVFDLSSFRRPDSHWEFIKPATFIPPPLTNHTMISFDHKLWVFGGDTPQGLTNELFIFDPAVNDWSVAQTTGTIPPPLQEHATVIYRDLMCVFGGKDSQDNYSNAVYFLNLKSLKWFKLPTFNNMIPRARSGHSLTLLPNSKILVMGGDKFDYAFANSTDLRTSDTDMGAGTIVYTLDLTKLNELCPGIFQTNGIDSLDNFSTPQPRSAARFEDMKNNKQASILSPDVPDTTIITPAGRKRSESGLLSATAPKPKSPIPLQDVNVDPPRVLSLHSQASSDPPSDTDPDVGTVGVFQYGTSPTKGEVNMLAVGDHVRSSSDYENNSPSIEPAIAALADPSPKPSTLSDVPQFDKSIETLANDKKSLDTLSEPARIISERNENNILKELLAELKQLKEDTVSSAAGANKRITELESENIELRKFNELTEFNNIIKHQSEVIANLQAQIDNKEKYADLESKYIALSEKNDALSRELETKEQFINENIGKCSESLDILIDGLKQKQLDRGATLSKHQDTMRGMDQKLNEAMLHNKELTTARDQLLEECSKLKDDYSTKHEELTKMEKEYRSVIDSVHNSGNALEKMQNEIIKLRQENSKLKSDLENNNSQDFDDSSGSLNDAHYQLKINDLRAELFITKQERDSLKDDVVTLKKKLIHSESTL
ncbi:unnamed protein product [Kluyveromyces dobzhanskii CBS 2104]|uniref:WGS project CCBQ000000000 data, contig 00046 n=1 Tax=Kluyveromyces dobzhanskii CBS 2104 TaxID=1427455 RepID=A0A0A8L9K8_9SACH|nr:unnamed protein product [Kluyveromyces dobzhanskii CBS 2104]